MYPKQMTQIIKDFYNNNNYSIRQIANIFKISKSTIHRWITKVYKDNNDKDDTLKKKIQNLIKGLLIKNPFMTINKIQNTIMKELKIKISKTGTYIHMRKSGFSFKKVTKKLYNKKETINNEINKFKKIVRSINVKDIICVDESGIKSNMGHEYGWSKKGERIIKNIKVNPKKFNLIMAISKEKIISNKIYEKNINETIFYEYLKEELLPKIKNKYMLMDNVMFHKTNKIKKLIVESGNKILFIPPYSPDFNPIEHVFHILKNKIRQKMCEINKEIISETIKNINNKYRKIYKKAFRT